MRLKLKALTLPLLSTLILTAFTQARAQQGESTFQLRAAQYKLSRLAATRATDPTGCSPRAGPVRSPDRDPPAFRARRASVPGCTGTWDFFRKDSGPVTRTGIGHPLPVARN